MDHSKWKIFIDSDFLVIELKDGYKYDIELKVLGNVLKNEFDSMWIFQVSNKTWSDREMLYELAKNIQFYAPENKFNWKDIFFTIEANHYINHLVDPENKDIRQPFDIKREELKDPKMVSAIKGIVSKKLKQYNLT